MMQRMSGRVSGLLDDLSDAISLLNDIMPSKASEQVPRYPFALVEALLLVLKCHRPRCCSLHVVIPQHTCPSRV